MKYFLLFMTALAASLPLAGGVVPADHSLDHAAEEYVKLSLAVGAYVPDYIDAYYGPKEWTVALDDVARRRGFPTEQFRKQADEIAKRLDEAARHELSALEKLRADFLSKQMAALKAMIDVVSGRKLSFDAESMAFYDAVAPVRRKEEFEKTLAALEAALPGPGSLPNRLAALRKEHTIPADKLQAVFDAAIAECRRRTLAHISLPAEENFKAAYVKDKPWGAYNWYKGNAFSIIEVNTDLPKAIDSPLGLAAHEGYPGHHVYNVLLEEKLAGEKGWIEFTIYPLFSPQSLIAEGTANYGIELIFPGMERLEFEKKVLYPLAGLDPEKAERYDWVQKLVRRLGYAEIEAARDYLDGRMSREEALRWMERYALETPEGAAKAIDFWNAYRSYIINYSVGYDLVREYVERSAGKEAPLARKWQAFYEILSTPRTPSGLERP